MQVKTIQSNTRQHKTNQIKLSQIMWGWGSNSPPLRKEYSMRCSRCGIKSEFLRPHTKIITNERVCLHCLNDAHEIKDHSWLYKKLNVNLPFLEYPFLDHIWTVWFVVSGYYYARYKVWRKDPDPIWNDIVENTEGRSPEQLELKKEIQCQRKT